MIYLAQSGLSSFKVTTVSEKELKSNVSMYLLKCVGKFHTLLEDHKNMTKSVNLIRRYLVKFSFSEKATKMVLTFTKEIATP